MRKCFLNYNNCIFPKHKTYYKFEKIKYKSFAQNLKIHLNSFSWFAKIIANTIDFYNVDFSQYELDIDRYVIDNSEGVSQEQYVVFANYEFNT